MIALRHRTTAPPSELRLPPHRRPAGTRTRLRTLRVGAPLYVAVLLLLPALVVGTAMATGWWATSGRTVSATGGTGAGGTGPGTGTGTGEGRDTSQLPATPADVKGWMTLQTVLDAFPAVNRAALFAELAAPAGTSTDTALKDLLEPAGIDVPALRDWLDAQLASS